MFKSKQIAFYSIIVVTLGVIAYFYFLPKPVADETLSLPKPQVTQSSQLDEKVVAKEPVKTVANVNAIPSSKPTPVPTVQPSPKSQTKTDSTKISSQSAITPTKNPTKNVAGVTIIKSEVTSTAKFYPITIDGIYMEVLAVKASDGSIRTAMNTCQVCYDSGRGYYAQVGNVLVCQNCKNKFSVDQVEIVKGGCNPVPVLDENKTDDGDTITIPETFLKTQKTLFADWKR